MDISKLTQGKNLTELDNQILLYIIENIDTVLQKGVREIAKENYTSPSAVIRLSKKLGYTGFIDLYYQLLPMVETTEMKEVQDSGNFFEISKQDYFQYNTMEDISTFVNNVLELEQKYIFIYATGFSAIIAEYLHKKLLVLGIKSIIATGTDSIGIFENNIEDIGSLLVISKSGETLMVTEKLLAAREHGIYTVSFTKESPNRAAELSDLNFKIVDKNKLDDRNMLPNVYFPRLLLLFEVMLKIYLEGLHTQEGKKEEL